MEVAVLYGFYLKGVLLDMQPFGGIEEAKEYALDIATEKHIQVSEVTIYPIDAL